MSEDTALVERALDALTKEVKKVGSQLSEMNDLLSERLHAPLCDELAAQTNKLIAAIFTHTLFAAEGSRIEEMMKAFTACKEKLK